jgi:hypothetical protein
MVAAPARPPPAEDRRIRAHPCTAPDSGSSMPTRGPALFESPSWLATGGRVRGNRRLTTTPEIALVEEDVRPCGFRRGAAVRSGLVLRHLLGTRRGLASRSVQRPSCGQGLPRPGPRRRRGRPRQYGRWPPEGPCSSRNRPPPKGRQADGEEPSEGGRVKEQTGEHAAKRDAPSPEVGSMASR